MGADENETTYYVGNVEFMVKANGTTVAKRYVGDAVITRYSDNINKISYLHRDHLGSVQTVTSQNYSELTTEHLSYDAYGRRRDAGNNSSIITQNPISDVTKRGYTGQEHVDQLGVINYNARLYDPELGMMLQADTIIPDGPVTQSLNRYSYVFNNPLSYTDPTGHNPSPQNYGWPAYFYARAQDALNELDQVQEDAQNRHHAELQQIAITPDGMHEAAVGAHQGNGLGILVNPEPVEKLGRKLGQSANDYLNELDQKAGQDFGRRFATQTEANMAAAILYGPLGYEAKREANWLTFKDESSEKHSYGFTYPGVGSIGKKKTKQPKRVRENFNQNNSDSLKLVSQGHSHFDHNESFSGADLESFIEKRGNRILVTRSGTVSYVNRTILKDNYGLKDDDVRSLILNKGIPYKTQNTGVYGKKIGNIYD